MSDLIPADSPDRCQRVTPSGQCQLLAVPGTDRCSLHSSKVSLRKNALRNYNLTNVQAQADVDRLAHSERLYSLEEEIAIMRWGQSQTLTELQSDDPMVRQLALSNFTSHAAALEKLIKTGSIVKEKFGNLLSKDAVLALAERIMQILSEEIAHVPDHEQIVDNITTRIAAEIEAARNTPKEESC